eukprot:gene8973-10628_t
MVPPNQETCTSEPCQKALKRAHTSLQECQSMHQKRLLQVLQKLEPHAAADVLMKMVDANEPAGNVLIRAEAAFLTALLPHLSCLQYMPFLLDLLETLAPQTVAELLTNQESRIAAPLLSAMRVKQCVEVLRVMPAAATARFLGYHEMDVRHVATLLLHLEYAEAAAIVGEMDPLVAGVVVVDMGLFDLERRHLVLLKIGPAPNVSMVIEKVEDPRQRERLLEALVNPQVQMDVLGKMRVEVAAPLVVSRGPEAAAGVMQELAAMHPPAAVERVAQGFQEVFAKNALAHILLEMAVEDAAQIIHEAPDVEVTKILNYLASNNTPYFPLSRPQRIPPQCGARLLVGRGREAVMEALCTMMPQPAGRVMDHLSMEDLAAALTGVQDPLVTSERLVQMTGEAAGAVLWSLSDQIRMEVMTQMPPVEAERLRRHMDNQRIKLQSLASVFSLPIPVLTVTISAAHFLNPSPQP